jgi:hypothetical protein
VLLGLACSLVDCYSLLRRIALNTCSGLGSHSRSVRYGSLFLTVPGSYIIAPTLSTWNVNNVAPHVRRATAVAIAFIFTNSGGILATWLLGSLSPPPRYINATVTFIVFSVVLIVFAGLNMLYLGWQNQKKAETRAKMTRDEEPAGLGDRSAWFIYSL